MPERHPLLPRWLVLALIGLYLCIFWLALLWESPTAERAAVGLLVSLVFVPAALRGLWHNDWGAYVYMALMAGLCYATLPYTAAGVVFLFYGQLFLSQNGHWRRSLFFQILFTGIAAVLGVRLGYPELFIIIAVLLIVFGALFDHLFYRFLQQQSDLLRSQDEAEHLARVAERERIARDLHDLLGHTLSSVRIKAELAGRLLYDQPDRAAKEVAEIEQAARQSLQQVRATVSGYQAGGLAAEINSARSLLSSAGVNFRASVDAQVTDRAQATLAAVLREGVTNIVRHAEATEADMSVTVQPDNWLLFVLRDNGRGLTGRAGQGMRGIRSRAAAAGGSSTWEAAHPGTRLNVWLPSDLEDTNS